jgi:sulfoxide reductase heme-binding subunit YedZ
MIQLNLFAQIARVTTPAQLNALVTKTYVLAVVAAVVAIGVAAVISQSIAYESGAKPKDTGKRRVVFWIVAGTLLALFFTYNALMVATGVRPSLQARFTQTYAIATGVAALSYLILGFVLSKVFRTGKFGSWFPSNGKS